MLRVQLTLITFVAGLFASTVFADETTRQAAEFFPSNTVCVVRINVETVAEPAFYENLAKGVDLGESQRGLLDTMKRSATLQLGALKKAGATTLHIAISMEPDAAVVIHAKEAADTEKILKHLRGSFGLSEFKVLQRDRLLVLSPERLGETDFGADERLVKEISAHAEAPVAVAVVLSDDHKRVLKELAPGNGDETIALAKTIANVQAASLWIKTDPKPSLAYELTSENNESAKELASALTGLLRIGAEMKVVKERSPRFAIWAKTFAFDSRVATVSGSFDGSTPLLDLATAAISDKRRDAFHMQTMNTLKQFALAFHNYADHHKEFPTRAIYDKEGKPLLSWRVSLLPYLDQKELYDKFHLEEPWDSPHNKKLILQMPPVFEVREPEDIADKEIGRTRIVAPIGEKSLFSYKKALHFADVVDGTSNTMLFMVAPKDKHVIWTKPDDLAIDYSNAEASVFGERTLLPFCMLDGSAHTWVRSGSNDKLRRLIQINDKEVIQPQ